MAWARIDDKLLDNTKVREAGKDAAYLYLSGLIYASNQMTDGKIMDSALSLVAFKGWIKNFERHADTLVRCDLWDRIEGGYSIHDYTEYNPTKAEVEAAREKKINAGRRGGEAKAQALAYQTPSTCLADAEQMLDHIPKHMPSNTLAISPTPTPTYKDKPEGGGDSARGEVFVAYENEIGMLTSFIGESLQQAEAEYSTIWVIEAIREASSYSGKSLKYVQKVLQNWKQHGFKVDSRPKRAYIQAAKNTGLDIVKAEMERMGIAKAGIFAEDNNG
jgi:DnaD/phage-associated family protein